MTRIHLATGLAIRGSGDRRCVLMVASAYENHRDPLWNLPGGRQQPGELLPETVVREVLEETGLRAGAGDLAYVSESYDGDTHFLNATFRVILPDDAEPPVSPMPGGDHVVAAAWVPLEQIGSRIVVGVVREPLLAYLRGDLMQRYAGFHHAGVTITWPASST